MEVYDEEGFLYPSLLDDILANELGEEDYSGMNKDEETDLFNELFSGTYKQSETLGEVSNDTAPSKGLAQNILEVEQLALARKKPMECPSCGKIYRNHSIFYETHVKNCKKKEFQNSTTTQHKHFQLLSCSICGSLKKNEETLSKHMYYCKKKCTVQCNHCSYKTKTIASLRSHIYHHHGDKDTTKNSDKPKTLCDECGKCFASRKSYRKHSQNCNNKGMDLHCYYCSFKCKTKWYLSRHIYDRHFVNGKFEAKDYGWIRPLECPVCRKTYKYQSSLSRHLTVCGKAPGFQCSLCSFKCSKKLYLELHRARQHSSDSNSNKNCAMFIV